MKAQKGHIRKRPNGSYEVIIDNGRDAQGRRKKISQTVRGPKSLAQKRLAELNLAIGQGSYSQPVNITVGEWLWEWLETYVAGRRDRRTYDSYREEIRRQISPGLGHIKLNKLNSHQVGAYLKLKLESGRLDGKEGGLSERTVRYHYTILSMALKDAVRAGHIPRNVCEAVDPPRVVHRIMETMALGDVARFLEAALKPPYYRLFRAGLMTGMRQGELLGLPWRAVDLDRGFLSVFQALGRHDGTWVIKDVKSRNSRRRISLSPSLVVVLRDLRVETEAQAILLGRELNGNDFVFAHPDGRFFDPSTVAHAFGKVLRQAGIPHIRFHDLRHTHATFLLGAGVNVKVVSERMGHASVAFTLDTYGHVMPGMQESAAERLDALVMPELAGMENADRTPADADPASKNVGRMLAGCWQNVGKEVGFEREPHWNRTSNLLIKRHDLSILLGTSDDHTGLPSQNPSLDDYPINHLILYGIAKFVGKMLVKILLLLGSIEKRKS